MSSGWDCRHCSFHHQYSGQRCVMCNKLRVDKEQMRDFILGKKEGTHSKDQASTTSSNVLATAPPITFPAVNSNIIYRAGCDQIEDEDHEIEVIDVVSSALDPHANAFTNDWSVPNNAPNTSATDKPRTNASTQIPHSHRDSRGTLPLSQQRLSDVFASSSHRPTTTVCGPPAAVATRIIPVTNPYARSRPGTASGATALSQSSTAVRTAAVAVPGESVVFSQSALPFVALPSDGGVSSAYPTNGNMTYPNIATATRVSSQNQPFTGTHAPLSNKQMQPVCVNAHPLGNDTNDTAGTGPTKTKTPFTVAAIATENRKRPRTDGNPASTPSLPYQPGPVPLDLMHAHSWVFPTDAAYPKRQYQFDMAQSAILQNTLVSLPTGLGKTLIAAVVLYNFYRWFPTGKVLFLAPTVPLVDQQIKACYEIMGIPVSDTTLLTGKIAASKRIVLWKTKRVFFCTPQTVQKDLEHGRCDASKVVCVVLDEAHKATGDYAYCKVIQYLEEAKAKFRILGLSATPGTSIKAISHVVNVLRVSCIEARSDADPDVKQYLHDRQTEVVVVKSSAATKPIERTISDMIAPILDSLRRQNALPSNLTDNVTITQYCLVRAREFYNRRPSADQDRSVQAYFAAGIRMVQIRSDLHKHGIGSVRSKLHQMRTERPRGYLGTIVKSKEFQSLWEEVETISCDPNSKVQTVDDKVMNNPKLEKLREILTEHFERSKACGTSSRAIVFSQFRNSVSEIVHVLNESKPLIRARQFVGQGKGSAKISEKENEKQSDGMKQSEQKSVLEEFKRGLHNALVCTSIGEEGLDIGEVDLIVNFDCLSSPIRMIQRVGRTGRKRDGRVVTLVAEGTEEKTLAKSRQNERNLCHALKNPKSFAVIPNALMFPTAPIVQEQNMAFSQHFHMSQMYGTTKRERVPATVLTKDWILSETEEWRISKVLGRLKDSRFDCTQSFHPSFPSIFRRRLLTGRSLSNTGSENTLGGRLTRGRTGQLLRMFESSFAIKCDQRLPLSRVSRNMGETALEVLFPLRLSKNSGVVWEDKLDAPDGTSPTTMGERPCISVIFEQSKDLSTGTLNSKNVPPRSTSLCEVAQMENAFATETLPTTTCGVHASNAMFSNMTKRTKQRGNVHSETLSLEPNKKMGLGDELTQPFGNSLHVPLPSLVGNMSFVCPEGCAIDDNREHPTTGSDESEQKILLNDCFEHEQDEFLLPSQHDSFSDDSDDEESASLRSESYANVENTESRTLNVNSLVANRKDEVFRLPTPSSSSEEESADEQDYDDLRNETVTAERLADITQRSQARVRFSLESSTCDATLEDRKISLRANPKSRKRILAINDTPESGGGPTTELPMIRLHSGVDYSLSNTQDESSSVGGLCQDLMCAKCQQGSLTNENPIISCDGYGTIQCGLAVHVACYELPSNETSKIDQKEWRCDVCNLLRSGGQQTSLSCATCRKKFGHMKVSSQGNWKHLNCNTNLKCGIERAWMDRLTKHQEAREPLRDSSPDENAISLSESLELKRKRRRQIMQFIDYEAQASGDDVSSDGREGEEVIAIEEEEEEFTKDFINDSSQLGYTQDELDQASAAGRPEGTSHRTLDAERDHIFQFATPRLNTRTRNRHSSDGVSGYSSSNSPLSHAAGESFRGLGNMHFIRSVLEHHRQGGTANEIESFYRNMEADEKEEIDGDSEWPS